MKKVSKVIAWILIVLLLAAGIGVIFVFTDGLRGDFKTFFIELDGERIVSSDTKRLFRRGEDYRFEMKYLFGKSQEERAGDYSVKIVANPEAEIEFVIDEYDFSWKGVRDITKCFDLQQDSSGFTFKVPEEITFRSVIGKLYPGQELSSAPSESKLQDLYPYMFLITDGSGEETYSVRFNFDSASYGITVKVSPESYGEFVDFRGATEAKGGTLVEFTLSYGVADNAPSMVLESVLLSAADGSGDTEVIGCNLQFVYSFEMPFYDVVIELKFAPLA